MGSSPVWSTNMKRVQLWSLSNFFGLIIPEKTGIIYSNQTGGVTCNHPEIEGYYIPLMTGWKPESDPLYNFISTGTLCAFFGLLAHSLGTNTFIIVRIMEPFWCLMGLNLVIFNIEGKSNE